MAKKKKPKIDDTAAEMEVLDPAEPVLDSNLDLEIQPDPEPKPEPKPKPQDKPEPKPLRPEGVNFKVFELVGGYKADQLGGFRSYATRMGLGPMSVKAWKEAYQEFLRLPA